jgi:hypothetical protein
MGKSADNVYNIRDDTTLHRWAYLQHFILVEGGFYTTKLVLEFSERKKPIRWLEVRVFTVTH